MMKIPFAEVEGMTLPTEDEFASTAYQKDGGKLNINPPQIHRSFEDAEASAKVLTDKVRVVGKNPWIGIVVDYRGEVVHECLGPLC